MSNETIADRIRYLIRMSRMTQANFASVIGIDPSNLSKHLSGKLAISEALINRIVVEMGVSKSWLKDGTDVPFAKNPHAKEIAVNDNSALMPYSSSAGVPVYDIDVTAGSAELSRMFTTDRIVGVVDLPQLNRDSKIVRVSGDSMEPVIKNGGYIAVRKLTSKTIFWGQIYVVILEDYRMVKYLRRHSDKNMVILHSANPNYDDIDISKTDIIDIYLVENILNFEIRC